MEPLCKGLGMSFSYWGFTAEMVEGLWPLKIHGG